MIKKSGPRRSAGLKIRVLMEEAEAHRRKSQSGLWATKSKFFGQSDPPQIQTIIYVDILDFDKHLGRV